MAKKFIRTLLLPLALMVLFQLNNNFSVQAQGPYTEVLIPVQLVADGPGETFEFEISSDYGPLPDKRQVHVSPNSRGYFGPISYVGPGTHTYKIRQVPGTNPDYVYDSRTYIVTVNVYQNAGGLAYTIFAMDEADRSGQKSDLIFNNLYQKPYPSHPTPRPDDQDFPPYWDWILWDYKKPKKIDKVEDLPKPLVDKKVYDQLRCRDLDFILVLLDQTIITSDGLIIVPDGLIIDLRGYVILQDGTRLDLEGVLIGNKDAIRDLIDNEHTYKDGLLILGNGLKICLDEGRLTYKDLDILFKDLEGLRIDHRSRPGCRPIQTPYQVIVNGEDLGPDDMTDPSKLDQVFSKNQTKVIVNPKSQDLVPTRIRTDKDKDSIKVPNTEQVSYRDQEKGPQEESPSPDKDQVGKTDDTRPGPDQIKSKGHRTDETSQGQNRPGIYILLLLIPLIILVAMRIYKAWISDD